MNIVRRFLLLAVLLPASVVSLAAEIRVMTSGGFPSAHKELVPEFERATGHRIVTSYGASQGGAPDSIPSRLARGEHLSTELFPKMGIWEEIKGRSRRIESARVATIVARGEAEIGFQQVSELLEIGGVDFVGVLPEGAQRVTTFSAGIATGATQPDAARELVRFYTSPAADPVIRRSGLAPATPRRVPRP